MQAKYLSHIGSAAQHSEDICSCWCWTAAG